MNIFSERATYKPFDYPWAYSLWEKHEKMHWVPSEVPLLDDVKDYNASLSQHEKNFLTQTFRLFTQMDTDVGAGYLNYYAPIFKLPELRMMLSGFAAREAVHQSAYSLLIDTIGFPEREYSLFLAIPEMKAKHEALYAVDLQKIKKFNPNTEACVYELLRAIALLSVFGEGVGLFSFFSVLLSFQKRGLMNGMCTIVEWSIKDEEQHVVGLTEIFNTIIAEKYEGVMPKLLEEELIDMAASTVKTEEAFIDLIFASANDEIQDITREEAKAYIQYLANIRLNSINIKAEVGNNPLPWIGYLVEGASHVNFLEKTSPDYVKGAVRFDFENIKF